MSLITIFLLLLGSIYGTLSLLAAIIQLNKEKFKSLALLALLFGAIFLLISVITKALVNYRLNYLLIIGLFLIHISAVANGIKMYGSLHIRHHAIRLAISAAIIALYFFPT